MRWRQLHDGELDHELLWLCVSVFALAAGFAWLHFGIPMPKCPFHKVTGWPCPGCGTTRCARQLLQCHWVAAFRLNPLAVLAGITLLVFDLYAAFALLLRSPRLRFEDISTRCANYLRCVIFTLLGLNWIWLLKTGV